MFPARFAARRGAPAVSAVGAVALTALTVACGSPAGSAGKPAAGANAAGVSTVPPVAARVDAVSAGSVPVGRAPDGTATVTGPAATALVNKAIADTQSVTSVRVTGEATADVVGTGTGPAQTATFDMTLVRNAGCEGTMAVSKTEAFRIVKTGGYVWLLPDSAFYAALGLGPAVQGGLAGKYLKFSAGSSEVGDLTRVCTLTGMLGSLPQTTHQDYTATPVTYGGAPAYAVTESGHKGIAYISRDAKPLLLRITQPEASAGTLAFTEYNAVTSITAPADAESINGNQFGF